jgi:hypothetical protein
MAILRSQTIRGMVGMTRKAFTSRQRVMTRSAGRSTGESPMQKAIWHAVEGAGRSHVIRNFFDLNEAQIAQVVTEMQAMMARRLQF